MLVLAILTTLIAVLASFLILFANGMRSSPGDFIGSPYIIGAWVLAAAMWVGWVIG